MGATAREKVTKAVAAPVLDHFVPPLPPDPLEGTASTATLETEGTQDLVNLDFRFPVDAPRAAGDDVAAIEATYQVIELEEDCVELEREKMMLLRKIDAAANLLKAARNNASSSNYRNCCPFCRAKSHDYR